MNKKLLALHASPREEGNSSCLMKKFLKGAISAGDVNIEELYLSKMVIAGCKGCMACRNSIDGKCVQNDDMRVIYENMTDSDVIVFSTPLHWWSVSSNMKKVIDRMYPFIGKGILDGKKVIVMVVGASDLENSGYDLTEKMLREICGYVGMELCFISVSADDERPASMNKVAMQEVFSAGKDII